jgi:hypothetical protein
MPARLEPLCSPANLKESEMMRLGKQYRMAQAAACSRGNICACFASPSNGELRSNQEFNVYALTEV